MFADLKNDYESISIAEYSKWIENWLSVLAELVDGEIIEDAEWVDASWSDRTFGFEVDLG